MAGAEGERWVGLATDFSEGSRAALRWAAANLLRAGDHLLLLHAIKEPDYEQSEAILWQSTGSLRWATYEWRHWSRCNKGDSFFCRSCGFNVRKTSCWPVAPTHTLLIA
ncbi:uncharacterized protein [Miscanthus floridulus]|uniref:uncharacterized protein n=1 Tax=Miscanthus floridulus TaxID=154761 RepID=UPI003458730D